MKCSQTARGAALLGEPEDTGCMGACWVRENYILGDRVNINVIRDGKRMDIPMTLKK